jgi:2-phosphoglycerate kinase
MTIVLHPEEPAAGPWRVERIAEVVARFADRAPPHVRRPLVIAVDGRSSSGKTTLATRIAAVIPATAVVHTDDIVW